MLVRNLVRLATTLFLFASLAFAVTGCHGSTNAPKLAHVKPGDMPEGGDWAGVYYSQVYGYLHMTTNGDTATGAWRNTGGDAWGELSGKVIGNVLRFEWREHKIGMVGANADRHGKGYFRYLVPKPGEAHEIHGEWGLISDEAGNEWQAVKQMNMQPNPASVRPDEVEGRDVGGGWDPQKTDAKPRPALGRDPDEETK